MKKILGLIVVLFVTTSIKAQLAVTNAAPYDVPTYLVNNVLLGNGVSADSISFSGNANQIGYFSNGLAGATNPLGIDAGIVLSSGNVNDIPNGGTLSTNFSGPGDADLLSIAQGVRPGITSTADAASLEFDFVPQGDTVEFRFVFASDEYKQWINSNYNDIFAFFLSGPGYTGPYAAPLSFPNGATNLALVPGTATPITISTIYTDPSQTPTQVNGQYYIDNPGENTFDFNGYTTIISIKFHAICNATYHFKFTVADCQDGTLDTGVLMEAGSFSSEAVQVDVVAASGDSTIIEGCADADIVFIRPDTTGTLTVNFVVAGTATNGVDYNLIADSVVFPAGVDTISLNITPVADGNPEGPETITITVTTIDPCGNTIVSTGVIYILDVPDLMSSSRDTTLQCPLTTIPISVQPFNALGPFTFVWTDSGGNPIGTNNDTIPVSGLVTDTFYVSITEGCNLVTINDTVIVSVTINQPEIDSTTVDSLIHCGESISVQAFMTSGTGTAPFTFSWNGITGNPSPTISPIADSTFYVTVTDFCGLTDIDSVIVTVDTIPVSIITSNDTTLNCPNNTVTISVGPTDVSTVYNYNWSSVGGSQLLFQVSPTQTDTFIVTASGGCNTSEIDTVIVTVDYTPMTVSLTNDITFKCPNLTYPLELVATPSGGTPPYTFNWGGISTDTDSIINVSISAGQIISVIATDFCTFNANNSMNVSFEAYTPISITTPAVDSVCANEGINISAIATNGVAPYSYSWSNGGTGATTLFSSASVGENVVTITITDECTLQQSQDMIVNTINCKIDLVNVITPNGDEMNDFLAFNGLTNFPNNRLTVVNRWGKTIFEKDNYQNDWNGDNASQGTYFYILELNNSANTIHKGTFTLLK